MKKLMPLIIILIFLVSCTNPLGGGPDAPVTEVDIFKGTKALQAEFLESAPPKETYEESPVKIGLMVRNEGPYDIKSAYIALAVENQLMELKKPSSPLMTFDIRGKTVPQPVAEQETYFFDLETHNITKQSEKMTTTILTTFCYNYKTIANPGVCIDTDIYNLRPGDKPCEKEDVSLDSQGAPIAVTLIESEMLPEGDKYVRPMFTIHVANKGNGEVLRPNKVKDACSSSPESNITVQDYNTFDYEVKMGGENDGIVLDCTPKLFRLKSDRDFIRCSLPREVEGVGKSGISVDEYSYTTPLYIKLNYGYTFSISRTMDIKRRTGIP